MPRFAAAKKKHLAPLSASLASAPSRWLGCILTGAQWLQCRAPCTIHPFNSNPPQRGPRPLTASLSQLQILQLPVFERPALELPAARRRSCQSCYFRELGEERENMYDVCVREGDSEFPVHIIALLRILVLSRHRT